MPKIALKLTMRAKACNMLSAMDQQGDFCRRVLEWVKSRGLKFNKYKRMVWVTVFSWTGRGHVLEILYRKMSWGLNSMKSMEVRDNLAPKLQNNACEKIVGLVFLPVFVCLTDEGLSHSVSFNNFSIRRV